MRHMANVTAYGEAVSLILHHPHTIQDLAEATGLSKPTVRKLIATLKTRRCVHISGWSTANRVRVPIYSWGDRNDVARPPLATRTNVVKTYRKRLREKKLRDPLHFMKGPQS